MMLFAFNIALSATLAAAIGLAWPAAAFISVWDREPTEPPDP